jgi:hypothetical protein
MFTLVEKLALPKLESTFAVRFEFDTTSALNDTLPKLLDVLHVVTFSNTVILDPMSTLDAKYAFPKLLKAFEVVTLSMT